MRRSDRELTDGAEIAAVLAKCDVLTLGIRDGETPYLLPVNFGMEPDGRTLYIHGAKEGTKYRLLERDGRVSFSAFCPGELDADWERQMCTMRYESVCGQGVVEELTDPEEKYRALRRILEHYHQGDFPVNRGVIPATRVLRLTVTGWTGKRRK